MFGEAFILSFILLNSPPHHHRLDLYDFISLSFSMFYVSCEERGGDELCVAKHSFFIDIGKAKRQRENGISQWIESIEIKWFHSDTIFFAQFHSTNDSEKSKSETIKMLCGMSRFSGSIRRILHRHILYSLASVPSTKEIHCRQTRLRRTIYRLHLYFRFVRTEFASGFHVPQITCIDIDLPQPVRSIKVCHTHTHTTTSHITNECNAEGRFEFIKCLTSEFHTILLHLQSCRMRTPKYTGDDTFTNKFHVYFYRLIL